MTAFRLHPFLVSLLFVGGLSAAPQNGSTRQNVAADGTNAMPGILANLPGSWRPFNDSSPWNTPIDPGVKIHRDSALIMRTVQQYAAHVRFGRVYIPPVWVVDATRVPLVRVHSNMIFDRWDKNHAGLSDVGVPVTSAMYAEPTKDGHIIVVDPQKNTAWEMSHFQAANGAPICTTFNIWDLNGSGVANPDEGVRWWARGGRGSGFPIIAGLLRPEELQSGEIRHALVFTFPKNRKADNGKQMFIPPAARGDGKELGREYPIEGMRLQLDPSLTARDFDRWGLTRDAKVVARALQRYGMYDGDNGGAMAIQIQLLAPTPEESSAKWDRAFPDLFKSIEKIPTDRFRVLYTGPPTIR
jgi:hypothetical protein